MISKIHRKILCMFLFFTWVVSFGQSYNPTLISNIKENKITRKEGLVWYDSNNIIRANFDEKYTSVSFTNPCDIAFEYLKIKHRELGLDKELTGIRQINSLNRVKVKIFILSSIIMTYLFLALRLF